MYKHFQNHNMCKSITQIIKELEDKRDTAYDKYIEFFSKSKALADLRLKGQKHSKLEKQSSHLASEYKGYYKAYTDAVELLKVLN